MTIQQKYLFSDDLIPDVEATIVSFADNKSLVALSGVSKYHNQAFTPSLYKERFLNLYKGIHPTPEVLFPHLRTCYPTCCWKVACCLDFNENPVTKFTQGFLGIAKS